MVITYYADVIFAWNFIMNFLILILIHPDSKYRPGKIAIAAAAGAGVVLVSLYLWKENVVLYSALRFLSAGLLCLIAMPNKGIGELLCNTALLYGVSGCIFGINTILSGYLGEVGNKATLSIILISTGTLFAGRRLLRFRNIRNKQSAYCFEVTLKNNNREIKDTAFYDSGNHLYEPISGKPVILIPQRIGCLLQFCNASLRVIPYSSLGNKFGMLNAYRLDELIIHKETDEVHYKEVYAAVADDEMFRQESCGVILHSEQI